MAHVRGQVGAAARCCLLVSLRMLNPGRRTTASATTTPALGGYNAQDPLGLAPRLASAQGYVDHAAHWVDVLGLHGGGHAAKAEKL